MSNLDRLEEFLETLPAGTHLDAVNRILAWCLPDIPQKTLEAAIANAEKSVSKTGIKN